MGRAGTTLPRERGIWWELTLTRRYMGFPQTGVFGWLRGVDLNHRPLGYEPNELPDCSTPQMDHNNRAKGRQTGLGTRADRGDILAARTVSWSQILSVARKSATNGKGHIQLRDQLLPRVSAPGTGAVRRCGNFENASFCEVRQTACRRGFHSRYHHAQDPSAYSSQTRSFDFALTSGLEITGPANP